MSSERRRGTLSCLLVAVALIVAAPLSAPAADAAPQAHAQAGGRTIPDVIVGFTYVVGLVSLETPGQVLRIRPGDAIEWTNLDPVFHDVTFTNQLCPRCRSTLQLTSGQKGTLVFPRAGHFQYFCQVHQRVLTMHGLVFVDPGAPL